MALISCTHTLQTKTHNGSSVANNNHSSSAPPLDISISHHETTEGSEEKTVPEEKKKPSFRRQGTSFDITYVPPAENDEPCKEDLMKGIE